MPRPTSLRAASLAFGAAGVPSAVEITVVRGVVALVTSVCCVELAGVAGAELEIPVLTEPESVVSEAELHDAPEEGALDAAEAVSLGNPEEDAGGPDEMNPPLSSDIRELRDTEVGVVAGSEGVIVKPLLS